MKKLLLPLLIPLMSMPAAGNDQTIGKIALISISIEVNDKPTLLVLLAADGTINRMGEGTEDSTDEPFVIDRTTKDYFAQLRSLVKPEWLPYLGSLWDLPNKKGKSAKLTISFAFEDGTRNGLIFKYGTESEGPPGEIREFVYKAVDLTDSWYEEWKEKSNTNPSLK
jgi:hypothetical protein